MTREQLEQILASTAECREAMREAVMMLPPGNHARHRLQKAIRDSILDIEMVAYTATKTAENEANHG